MCAVLANVVTSRERWQIVNVVSVSGISLFGLALFVVHYIFILIAS